MVAGALADADEVINSYLGRRYDLPLATTPAALKRVAADVARFLLYKDDPTEAVQNAHDGALAWLKDVSAGKAVLDIAGEEAAPAEATVQIASQDKLFGRDKLEGF